MVFRSDREVNYVAQQFNMSLATLERIDSLIKELHENWVDGNVLAIQRILFSVYKELYPFLTEKEREIGNEFFEEIKHEINFDDNTGQFSYTAGITVNLHDFDFWIRDQLHKKNLLFGKGEI